MRRQDRQVHRPRPALGCELRRPAVLHREMVVQVGRQEHHRHGEPEQVRDVDVRQLGIVGEGQRANERQRGECSGGTAKGRAADSQHEPDRSERHHHADRAVHQEQRRRRAQLVEVEGAGIRERVKRQCEDGQHRVMDRRVDRCPPAHETEVECGQDALGRHLVGRPAKAVRESPPDRRREGNCRHHHHRNSGTARAGAARGMRRAQPGAEHPRGGAEQGGRRQCGDDRVEPGHRPAEPDVVR